MDLGSDKIPESARKYVIENNLTKEEQKYADGGYMAKGGKNTNSWQKYLELASERAFEGGGNGSNITDYGLSEVAMYIDQDIYSRETRNLFVKLVDSMVNDEIKNNQVGTGGGGGGDYKKGGHLAEKTSVEVGNEKISVIKRRKEKTGYPVYVNTQGYAPMTLDVYPTKELATKKAKALANKEGYTFSNWEKVGEFNLEPYAKGGRLSRKQKQLDLNKNGKLDSQDFKMLRAKRKNARKK
jgi:hypothetical protein